MKFLKFVKIFVIAVLLLGVVFVGVGFVLPTEFEVSVSLKMDAEPGAVYPSLVDLREWPLWTPWNSRNDPSAVHSFSGPESGVGATMSWTGDYAGSLVISRALRDERIDYEIRYEGNPIPVEGTIELLPSPTGTIVSWTRQGDVGMAPIGGYLVRWIVTPGLTQDLRVALENLRIRCEHHG